jgi:organic hydroperoxide reductase OsmC/OhrA
VQPLPHHYEVTAAADATGDVELGAPGVPALASAAPAEFGGPGNLWSPETLLVGAVADCFILTFRAIARASRLDWTRLECRAEGTLDRVDGVTRFVGIRLNARLVLPAGGNEETGKRLLQKAEKGCLVTNSLSAPAVLEAEVSTA